MKKYQVGLKKLLTYKTPYIIIQKSQEIEIPKRILFIQQTSGPI